MKKNYKKSKKISDFDEIYGIHPVKAAIENKNRKHKQLIISANNKEFLKEVKIQKDIVKVLPHKEFIKYFGNESVHQGIALQTTKIIQPEIDFIIKQNKNKKKDIIVMLDHVTDPHNIGSIIRSCYLFGCLTVIVAKDNAPDITASMTKAASGAIESVNYLKVKNLSRTIDYLKVNNYWAIGFDNNSEKLDNKINIPERCLMIFGSEGKGLRVLTKKNCDKIISIPFKNNNISSIDSLNVSSACAIALYAYYQN